MKSKMNQGHEFVDESKLNSSGQQTIRNLVSSLPDEPLSMAWRSSLNEQVRLMAAKKQKRRRLFWVASPIAGLSLTGALAFIVMIQPFSHKPIAIPDRGLETAILKDHHNSTLGSEMTSAGLNLTEVTTDANESDPDEGVWNEADVQSL